MFTLGLGLASLAEAQTKSKALGSPASTTNGAFDKLSPGSQKVASALYQAQRNGTPATGVASTPSPAKPLTLDEIAARSGSGQRWIQVFKDMKAQGLVQEKSLGHVVSKYGHLTDPGLAASAGNAGNGKAHAQGGRMAGSGSGISHGYGIGGK